MSCPSINWWPGNLRPHESRISFVARFCELNGIKLAKCKEFFKADVEDVAPLPGSDVRRIAGILNENLQTVETVFASPIRFDCRGGYGPPLTRRDSSYEIRYCETCARQGYHSYLHEAEWLLRCPLHVCDLKTARCSQYAGSIATRHMLALKHVMQEHCKTWPHARDGDLPTSNLGPLAALAAWVTRASHATARLTRKDIWRSGYGGYSGSMSLSQTFGQLRTLEPIPDAIQPLFVDLGEAWRLEVWRFSPQIRSELARLKAPLGFLNIFYFFKRIGAVSATPPSFVAHLAAARGVLHAKHGSCQCRWGLTKGFNAHWDKVHPDEYPHWLYSCPYEVALTELEIRSGRPELFWSNRKAEEERIYLMNLSSEMYKAGLIRYTKGEMISPDGYLHGIYDLWPCCEWLQGSPLTSLLNATAEREIDSSLSALTSWLDEIEQGAKPGDCHDPIDCVRVCETDEGRLSLIKWARSSELS